MNYIALHMMYSPKISIIHLWYIYIQIFMIIYAYSIQTFWGSLRATVLVRVARGFAVT